MTAFRVYGVTEKTALRKAKKDNPDVTGGGLAEIANEIYEKMNPVQISENFDAPQFCDDFIALAKKTIKCRALKIMCYQEKKKKNGQPVISKKTGKPTMTWQKYEETKQ